MSLWVPPNVSREIREETAKANEATLSMFQLQYGILDKWNRELKKFDPLMRLGKAHDNAEGIGVIPGYYHLIRINPGQPIWCLPIHDNGKYAEPTNAMLDMLRNSDMQNPQVLRDKERMAKAEAKAKARAKETKREEREGSMMEHWRSIYQPQIAFSDDKWTNSTSGKRGRKAA